MSDSTLVQRVLRRREFMQVGGAGVLSFGLAELLELRRLSLAESSSAESSRATKSKSCVVIWLDGGPSHLETLDPKSEAPREVRGPLDSIATKLPGVELSECLPLTAQRLDRMAIVRSMTSPLGEHNFGTHYLMTGYRPTPVLEYPAFTSAVAEVQQHDGDLPAHIAVPDFRVGGGNLSGNGFLNRRVAPFSVGGDPAKPDFSVRDLQPSAGLDTARLSRRRSFVEQLDEFSRQLDATGGAEIPSESQPVLEQAWRLIASPAAKQAFDLSAEPDSVRNRYGRRTVGQSCLLARRLIERGVPFVTVNYRGWDTHNDLYTRLKEGFTGAKTAVGLIPSLDLALTALMDDLQDRGLLDETLIVVMGEFGRTPKLNPQGGRDHWPRVFSVALAGGGIRGGQIIGSSDRTAESPHDRPVTPGDLTRTIYRLLGIDPDLLLHTSDGRPVRLAPESSQEITELI
jgi:hypothetical protein